MNQESLRKHLAHVERANTSMQHLVVPGARICLLKAKQEVLENWCVHPMVLLKAQTRSLWSKMIHYNPQTEVHYCQSLKMQPSKWGGQPHLSLIQINELRRKQATATLVTAVHKMQSEDVGETSYASYLRENVPITREDSTFQ